MITPRMDRNGYFSYVASTAKKKKINLMQSKLPRMAFVYSPDGGKSSPQQENLLRDPLASQSRVSRARTSVADGRALMTHRAVARAPRAPDPWSEKPQQCKSVEEHQKLQNRPPIYQQGQEDRYKDLKSASCHRQQQPPELVYQSKSNNSQLECYSPKYHHIRPQPKGAPTPPAAGYQNYPIGRRDGQFVVNQSVVPSVKSGNKWSEDGGDSQNRHAPKLNGLYTESQFSYRVNGHPGNLAQASAAAAFFARYVIFVSK